MLVHFLHNIMYPPASPNSPPPFRPPPPPLPHTQFMHLNNLKLICRAHQLVHEGIKYMFDSRLVTVWSAPNYCYRCGNIASILVLHDDNLESKEAKLFSAVPDSERVIPQRVTTPYFL